MKLEFVVFYSLGKNCPLWVLDAMGLGYTIKNENKYQI